MNRKERIWCIRIGVFAALSVLDVLLAIQFVNRYVEFELESSTTGRSVRAETPVGAFQIVSPPPGSNSLSEAIFPDSRAQEQLSSDFFRGAAGNETKVAQLSILRLIIHAPLQQAGSWYEGRLKPKFSRSSGWPSGKDEDWKREVLSEPIPDAIVFERLLSGRASGVILERGVDGRSTRATLFDYQYTSKR